MKLIKRLICLFKGHKWRIIGVTDKIDNNDGVALIDKCSRCGKIQEIEML